MFDPEILDITDADLLDKLQTGVRNAAMSLAMNYPNVASVPHSIVNGMKNLLAIAAATEITFKRKNICMIGNDDICKREKILIIMNIASSGGSTLCMLTTMFL